MSNLDEAFSINNLQFKPTSDVILKTYEEILEEIKTKPILSKSSDKIKKIGFWSIDPFNFTSDLPFPIQNTSNLNSTQKTFILDQFKKVESKSKSEFYLGFSICRICEKPNGNIEYTYNNGTKDFIFPQGYKHYLEDHDVEIDPEFLDELNKI